MSLAAPNSRDALDAEPATWTVSDVPTEAPAPEVVAAPEEAAAPEEVAAEMTQLTVSEEVPASNAKSPGAVYGGVDADSAYKQRQAKILASNAPSAAKGKALREAKAEAAAKGEKWTPNVPGTDAKETRDETGAPRAPGAVYGQIDPDSAHKKREAKILASKAAGADKGAALRAARAEAARKGEKWTPDVPNAEGTPMTVGTAKPGEAGAVYGGPAEDSAFMIREAKILASKSPAADKAAALRYEKATAAAKGKAWTPSS